MTTLRESTLPDASPLGTALAGKYLTFSIGEESYGIAVLKVREIIRMLEITAVPQMPEYVRGVVNLRGKIIPVIDLRRRFGMTEGNDADDRTCIIVVQALLTKGGSAVMGMVVDEVEEVVDIESGDVEATPDFGTRLRSDYILGMSKVKGRIQTLLDIDRVILADELIEEAALAV